MASQTVSPAAQGAVRSRHVVVTGLGAVCAAGVELPEIWAALREGRSAIAPIAQWDTAGWPVRRAGEIRAESRILVEDRKLHKFIRQTDMCGIAAGERAIRQADFQRHRGGLDEAAAARFNDRTGLFAGSGGGSYRSQYEFFPVMAAAGEDLGRFGRTLTESVNPMWLLRNLPNNVLCHLGIRHGFKGTNACVTNHGVSGMLAVIEAAAAIRAGEADRAVAVGHDAPVEPETVLYYHQSGLLADDAVRPFDAMRRGALLGDGAGAMVLEAAEEAAGRGASALGEILGSGCVSEGEGLLTVRPDGEGTARAIQAALQDAGIGPEAVGMIVAHGLGTPPSDASEAAGIRRIFGQAPPPVTAFKWAFGYAVAASGALDLVLALTALHRGTVPGIATLERLDPDLAPLPVSATAQPPTSDIALVICRGFGGMHAAVLLRAAARPSHG